MPNSEVIVFRDQKIEPAICEIPTGKVYSNRKPTKLHAKRKTLHDVSHQTWGEAAATGDDQANLHTGHSFEMVRLPNPDMAGVVGSQNALFGSARSSPIVRHGTGSWPVESHGLYCQAEHAFANWMLKTIPLPCVQATWRALALQAGTISHRLWWRTSSARPSPGSSWLRCLSWAVPSSRHSAHSWLVNRGLVATWLPRWLGEIVSLQS